LVSRNHLAILERGENGIMGEVSGSRDEKMEKKKKKAERGGDKVASSRSWRKSGIRKIQRRIDEQGE